MQFDLNVNPLDRVIAGFPGVGKSYLFNGNNDQYADSDSSTFDKSDFPANYMRHIAELLGSTDKTIFVSTHDTVRQALIDNGISYTLVYPEMGLKEEYLQRYRDRGSPEAFVKMMSEKWEDFISGCERVDHPSVTHIVLLPGQRLADVI